MNLLKIIKLRNLILSLVAYEKLIPLMFMHKVISWHCVDVSLLSYFFHSVLFFFINSFIASLSLFWFLSHTLFLCTSLKPLLSLSIYVYLLLNLTFTLRIAIILLLVLHISLSHSLSVSLAQPLTMLHFMIVTLFLSFLRSSYDMIIIIIVLFLF